MSVLILTVGVVVLATAAVMLARACGPTRGVGQLLYETEHPAPTSIGRKRS